MKHEERLGIGRWHRQVGITALFVGLNVSRSEQNYMYIRIEIYMTSSSALRKEGGDQLTRKNICYMAKPLHPPALIGQDMNDRPTRAKVLLTGNVHGLACGSFCKILNAGELFNTFLMHPKNSQVVCNDAGIFVAF